MLSLLFISPLPVSPPSFDRLRVPQFPSAEIPEARQTAVSNAPIPIRRVWRESRPDSHPNGKPVPYSLERLRDFYYIQALFAIRTEPRHSSLFRSIRPPDCYGPWPGRTPLASWPRLLW